MTRKLTYGKSEPYKSGWKGWADWVDVFLDGVHIGMLYVEGGEHRKHMEYTFTDRLGNMQDSPHSGYKINVQEFGLRAAKAKLQALLDQWERECMKGTHAMTDPEDTNVTNPIRDETKILQCSICGNPILPEPSGWTGGHNAEPINDGRCCSECNVTKVVPARLAEIYARKDKTT